MWNATLDEAQAGLKIAGRNINNLRYAEDTTLMAEREEELKNLLIKVKEENEKAGLKQLHIQKTKITASSAFTSWQMGKQWKDKSEDFDCVDHNKLWKIWKRWQYQTTWPASWEICRSRSNS